MLLLVAVGFIKTFSGLKKIYLPVSVVYFGIYNCKKIYCYGENTEADKIQVAEFRFDKRIADVVKDTKWNSQIEHKYAGSETPIGRYILPGLLACVWTSSSQTAHKK